MRAPSSSAVSFPPSRLRSMSSTTRTGLELGDDALDHVREAPPGLVRDLEHPFGGHVLGHDHEVASLAARSEAPRRVRHDERLDSPGAQDTDRECDRLRLIALVVMEPSVHDGDILALQPADDELARVAGRRASLEAGDLGIRDARGGGDLLGEAAEAAPQDHRDLRRGPRLRANRRDGGANIARAHLGSFRIFSRSSSTKGRVCAVRAKRATGSALRTVILSPFLSSCSSCPSSDRIAGSSCTSSSSSCSGSNTTALPNERCGAIGTIVIERDTGRMSGPPTEKPYAVLPVAVATMRPSAQYTMSGSLSTRTATLIERTCLPRATTTSFSASARAVSPRARASRASRSARSSVVYRPATTSARAASNGS